MNLLFDGNYLFHKTFSVWSTYHAKRNASAEENEEALLTALQDKEQRQVLLRKLIIDMCATVNRFDDVSRVVVVFDSYSWRYRFHPDYKYARTRVRSSYYKEFNEAINMFAKFLQDKGIIVSRCDGAEGDDLLYIWSLHYSKACGEEVVIVTGDSDIRQVINERTAVFCNNSKNLKLYCDPENESRWKKEISVDVTVEPTNAFNVLLYKVIMGDTSDNIPKLKKGFGDVAFGKFINHISDKKLPIDQPMRYVVQWIKNNFCEFAKVDPDTVKRQIGMNLFMTWLDLEAYYEDDYVRENVLYGMIEELEDKSKSYNYNKPYTLEDLYGMIIK